MHENRIFIENPWQREIEYRELDVDTEHNLNEKNFYIKSEMNNQIRDLVRNFLERCD